TDLRTRLEHLPTWRYGTARQCREWREVRSGLGRLDLAGCTVLDFGCGRYHPLGQSALAAASGAARTIALDVLPVVDARRAALATSELLGQTLLAPEAVLGAVAPPRSSVLARIERHFDLDRLAALRWHEARRGPCSYLVEPIEACSIEPESIDVVVSRDVVEHIGDVPAALSALRRLVGPGARLVLFIDFTDHRRYLDPGVYEHWSHLVDLDEPTHLATNRLRFPQYPPLFEAAGFRVTRWHPTASEPIPAAHAAGLAPPYRDMTTADLSVCGAVAVLEPAGT
ncbi:MAG: class I SAM-dependent methyltransferase, partial [Planctomycetota bacterium]